MKKIFLLKSIHQLSARVADSGKRGMWSLVEAGKWKEEGDILTFSIISNSTYIICCHFGVPQKSGRNFLSTALNIYQCNIGGSEIAIQIWPVILRAPCTMNKHQIIIFKRSFGTIELCYLTSKHIQDVIARNVRWHSKQRLAIKGAQWWLFSVTCHLVISDELHNITGHHCSLFWAGNPTLKCTWK